MPFEAAWPRTPGRRRGRSQCARRGRAARPGRHRHSRWSGRATRGWPARRSEPYSPAPALTTLPHRAAARAGRRLTAEARGVALKARVRLDDSDRDATKGVTMICPRCGATVFPIQDFCVGCKTAHESPLAEGACVEEVLASMRRRHELADADIAEWPAAKLERVRERNRAEARAKARGVPGNPTSDVDRRRRVLPFGPRLPSLAASADDFGEFHSPSPVARQGKSTRMPARAAGVMRRAVA